MSIVVTAVFQPRVGHSQELISALRATIPAVHEEAGCRLYAIHEADNGTITMIEKWDDAELLAIHAAGAAVVNLNAAIADHISSPTTVTTMTPISAGTPSQGLL